MTKTTATTTATTPATGTCQVCGRTQKLTGKGQTIARHGFTLSGLGVGSSRSCYGSGRTPIEAGEVNAFAAPIEHAHVMRAHAERDLAEYSAPGFAGWEGCNVAKAIAARRMSVASYTRTIAWLTERAAKVAAIIAAKA